MIPSVRLDNSFAAIPGYLSYELKDFSFLFEYASELYPAKVIWPGGVFSLCFGHLQVDIYLATSQWLGVDGLTNYQHWIHTALPVPEPTCSCGLFLDEVTWAERGVAYQVTDSNFENRFFDVESGWFCTGDPRMQPDVLVEFATGCVASVTDSRVVALWLRPQNWRSIDGDEVVKERAE